MVKNKPVPNKRGMSTNGPQTKEETALRTSFKVSSIVGSKTYS